MWLLAINNQQKNMTWYYNNPYSKVVGSLSVCVCVCVCVRLNNSGTAGPIWLNFFLLAPFWSQGGYRPKNPDPDFFLPKTTL